MNSTKSAERITSFGGLNICLKIFKTVAWRCFYLPAGIAPKIAMSTCNDSKYGRIENARYDKEVKIHYYLTVPANTSATLKFPVLSENDMNNIMESGTPAPKRKELDFWAMKMARRITSLYREL